MDPTLHGCFERTEDGITYKPKSFLVKRRDHIIEELRTGSLTHCSLARFVTELPDLYKTKADVQAYFEESMGDRCYFASGYAISEAWLQGDRQTQVSNIASLGFADMSVCILSSRLPKFIY